MQIVRYSTLAGEPPNENDVRFRHDCRMQTPGFMAPCAVGVVQHFRTDLSQDPQNEKARGAYTQMNTSKSPGPRVGALDRDCR